MLEPVVGFITGEAEGQTSKRERYIPPLISPVIVKVAVVVSAEMSGLKPGHEGAISLTQEFPLALLFSRPKHWTRVADRYCCWHIIQHCLSALGKTCL